ILAPAVFRSMSEFDERSRQLAALEKELLARSEQLAAREKELLARNPTVVIPAQAARAATASEEMQVAQAPTLSRNPTAPSEMQAAQAPSEMQAAEAPPTIEPSILCKNLTEPFEHLICADADLAFWQNLVSEIYQHRWRQLDTNGQQ